MNAQRVAETKCREIYVEAQTFFANIHRQRDYGFKILNPPPVYKPPFLFVGYQPGSGAADFKYETCLGTHLHWPLKCEYATATWTLAQNMRRMFGPEVLARCMGVNAIFLRSPNIADYNRNVDRQTRAQVTYFCKTHVLQIIDVVDPDKIVVIEFSTLKLFGPTEPDLINAKGRILTRTGKIGNRKAVAMLHLSGAYISNADRDFIRDRILAN
jgi:hypothetical protein